MTSFADLLQPPKAPVPLPGTPFVTLPTPQLQGPPGLEPPPNPLEGFVTSLQPPPIGQGDTTPLVDSPLGQDTGLPSPDEIKQRLVEAGFDPEGADAVTQIGNTLDLSPERIAELLQVRIPAPREAIPESGVAAYESDVEARRDLIYSRMKQILSDPRLRDEYTRGMTAINATTAAPGALGDYSPSSQSVNIYDVEERLNRPGGEGGLGATAKHETGHHIAQQMLQSTYIPEGYAAAIQLDYERRKDEGRDNPISPWASDYAASGQARGASIAEDFADAMKMRLSDLGSQREAFRKNFPARAAFLDALLYAMVNPDKEGARLGVQREREGSEFGQGRGTMGPFDAIVGRASAARNLLEQEIAMWRGRGREDIAADLSSKRKDDKLMPKYFDQRVTNPAILQALRTFQQGGYRYDQETE